MANMFEFLSFLDSIVGNSYFLLFVFIIFFSLKLGILIALIARTIHTHTTPRPLYFLIMVLVSSMITDIDWILTPFKYNLDYRIVNTFQRTAWAFTIVLYQSLALFIESLTNQQKHFNLRQKIFLTISFITFIFLISLTLVDFNCPSKAYKHWIEFYVTRQSAIYLSIILMPLTFAALIIKLKKIALPRILTKQLTIFLGGVIIPFWFFDFIQIPSLIFSPINWVNTSLAFVSLANMLLTFGVYYSARKVMGLRFLNLKTRVQIPTDLNFMDNFKTVLERLSQVSSEQELSHITQSFFKDMFNVPFNKTVLYIRHIHAQDNHEVSPGTEHAVTLIETFMSTHPTSICAAIKEQKILIYDELTFSNFYEKTDERNQLIAFLNAINADVFLPIYEKNSLVAYIVIERFARIDTFYSEIEHDEMLVFASYLGNIINLLQNRNLDMLLEQEKQLKEELYYKHQEINQYKESIRSFLRNNKQKTTGIIFYKNRKFTFGNQAAKEMINININQHEGHPVTKALKRIAEQVEIYKAPQTCITKDNDGTQLVLSAVPNLENNNVIITISYPEISDIIKKQIDVLKDPSERDYLLYLETTQSGKLINQLIPSNNEIFLNFKINLLQTALSKKATLLTMPEQDLLPTVELLHHISLRDTLHTLNLTRPSNNLNIAIQLFGINPIFGISSHEKPLLEQLNNVGTLFIKNIHFLDLETQKYLAEFIRYGFYHIFKSEQKQTSNVRIICSTEKNLHALVQDGTFAQELFDQIKQTAVIMPSLLTLPEQELDSLTEELTEQALKQHTFKNLLTLTPREKNRIIGTRPASLHELKNNIQQILLQKSKNNEPESADLPIHSSTITEHNLAAAARLGKHALRDEKTMRLLWQTFGNQNKIATFLGVNRSSVNRRCQKYDLK